MVFVRFLRHGFCFAEHTDFTDFRKDNLNSSGIAQKPRAAWIPIGFLSGLMGVALQCRKQVSLFSRLEGHPLELLSDP